MPGRRVNGIRIARTMTISGETLNASDGAAIKELDALAVHATKDTEALLFDMA